MRENLKEAIIEALKARFDSSLELISNKFQGGGDINEASRIETSKGSFFVKWNSATKFPDMLKLEANGLNLLAGSEAIKIPEVVSFGKGVEEQFLVLEWVEESSHVSNFWQIFGQQLANLHSHTFLQFGNDQDNYIGSLKQKNSYKDNWNAFFVENRLEVQLEAAFNQGIFSSGVSKKFQNLFTRLDQWIPEEKPALIHGDLWSGNFISSKDGPVLIDPAVYYGHREMDLAMMHLFGGFDSRLFLAYNEQFPLETGWRERISIHNLYPLLVHVNLFGGGYKAQVENTLNRYV